jgi:hypothetical protein
VELAKDADKFTQPLRKYKAAMEEWAKTQR